MTRCPHCGGDTSAPPELRMTGEFATPNLADLARAGDAAAAAAARPPAAPSATSCSWCGKKASEVKKLLTGPGVQICNECVALCHMILKDELPDF